MVLGWYWPQIIIWTYKESLLSCYSYQVWIFDLCLNSFDTGQVGSPILIFMLYVSRSRVFCDLVVGTFQLPVWLWLLGQIGDSLFRPTIATHKECHFKFRNRSQDVEVITCQIEYFFFSLSNIPIVLMVEVRVVKFTLSIQINVVITNVLLFLLIIRNINPRSHFSFDKGNHS